jgi:IS30 family transposase
VSVSKDVNVLGFWRGDTVYRAEGKGTMLTLADRKSRLLYAALVESRDSGVIFEAFKRGRWGTRL